MRTYYSVYISICAEWVEAKSQLGSKLLFEELVMLPNKIYARLHSL